jgi:hypothetical protein
MLADEHPSQAGTAGDMAQGAEEPAPDRTATPTGPNATHDPEGIADIPG